MVDRDACPLFLSMKCWLQACNPGLHLTSICRVQWCRDSSSLTLVVLIPRTCTPFVFVGFYPLALRPYVLESNAACEIQ